MEGYGNENPGAFQSTRPLRGATVAAKRTAHERPISTHVPLAGRDPQLLKLEILLSDFNPRAPCGARPVPGVFGNTGNLFQPTRPLRGATLCAGQRRCIFVYFNPRAPCGARPGMIHGAPVSSSISTHAPLAGRDIEALQGAVTWLDFNPRAPCGARPGMIHGAPVSSSISTHAPLAGRDIEALQGAVTWLDFNPRAPCGARQLFSPIPLFLSIFQPTRPLRGATI